MESGLSRRGRCFLKCRECSVGVVSCDSRVAVAEREERGGPGCRCIALVDSRTLRLRSVYDTHRTDLTSVIAC
jgi:hypothetical protein